MINWFFRRKTADIDSRPLNSSEIFQANRVLFSLFTRYGDTIIDLVVIKEFIGQHPDKEHLVLCPRQMEPYVNELLPGVRCVVLNKRNLFDMIKTHQLLKQWKPDIGFNPWSNGLDSCYFLTYCRRYYCYKDFERPNTINHYQVVRRYLKLPEKAWKLNEFKLQQTFKHVLICPESTDPKRSVPQKEIERLILDVKRQSPSANITIAALDKSFFKAHLDHFSFQKTADSSRNFIHLVKQSDLVICSDSGPLHIANALGKNVLAFFYSTRAENVINAKAKVCLRGV